MAIMQQPERAQRNNDTVWRQEQERLALSRLAVLEQHEREQMVNSRRRQQVQATSVDSGQGRVIRCPHCGDVLERFSA
jgi:hypothetical protein